MKEKAWSVDSNVNVYSTLPHRRRNMTLIFTESPDTLKLKDQRSKLVTSHILSFALEFRLRIQVWGDGGRIGREGGRENT